MHGIYVHTRCEDLDFDENVCKACPACFCLYCVLFLVGALHVLLTVTGNHRPTGWSMSVADLSVYTSDRLTNSVSLGQSQQQPRRLSSSVLRKNNALLPLLL